MKTPSTDQSKYESLFLKSTLLLVSIMTVMSAATIAPALPLLADVFKSTPNAELLSKLVLSVPALFIALSAPFTGKFIDRYGRLNLLYFGLILYALSGTSGYFLNNIYHILIGRILLGVSIGITMTIAITLTGDYFEGDERKRFIGFQGAFIAMGGVVFITIGGYLADIDWKMPFLIYGLSLFVIPLVLVFLKEPAKPFTKTQPSLEKSNGLINIIYATAVVFMILFYIIPIQLPFQLKEIGIEKHSLAGITLAINAIGAVIGSLLYSRVKQKIEFAAVFSVGFLIMAIGYLVSGLTSNFPIVIISMFIAGLGFGLILPNMNLWVIQLTKAEVRGRNMGVLTTSLFLGQFLSPLVVEPLILIMDLSMVFSLAGGSMLLMSLAFVLLNNSKWITNPDHYQNYSDHP